MGNVFLHDQTSRYVGVIGANGRIVVTCPSGCSVRAILGETEYIAIADDTEKVVFDGLGHGTWTVEVNNDQQTITKNVEVLAEYEVDMEFITAEIHIDYPVGSTCTCSNGIVEYQAPDTNGYWKLTVSDSGTWTVTCTNGIRTENRDININANGQVEHVRIAYFEATIRTTFPVGATCTCYKDGTYYTTPDYSGAYGITTITHDFTVGDPGEWTIECSKDGQTEIREIEIIADGQITNVDIVIFEATFIINYDPGCLCTCGNGVITYTAPDTSGKWECIIPEPGYWEVTCVNNGLVKQSSKPAEINGETRTVDMTQFMARVNVLYPEGWILSVNGTYSDGYDFEEQDIDPERDGSFYWEDTDPLTCTFTCTSDTGSKSETVELTEDWQVEYINLTEFDSTIDVTYPAGATCYCTDGSTTITAPNTSGRYTFMIPRVGTWKIVASDDEQTVESQVEIIGDAQYESVTIKFFSATIAISYPAGAVCTCTDGTSMYTAPDTSGYWSLKVPRKNEWLITVKLNGQTVSGSVHVIADTQYIKKTVKFFEAIININYPVGANCILTDDKGYTYYAPDSSGKWTQTVPRTGTWRISAELDGRTCGGTVEIVADEQVVNKTVKFFAATINITYPAGSVCTCVRNDRVYEYEARDTSGSWQLVVPTTGTWIIEAVSDEQTVSGTVEITEDEQVENITVKFFEATIEVVPFVDATVIYCSDGITEYEMHNVKNSDYARFIVPRTGTWVITIVIDSLEYWPNREITREYEAIVSYNGEYVRVIGRMSQGLIQLTSSLETPIYSASLYLKDSYDDIEIYSRTWGEDNGGTKYLYVCEPGDYILYIYRVEPYDGIELNTGKCYTVNMTWTIDDVLSSTLKQFTPVYKYLPEFTYSISDGYQIFYENISDSDDVFEEEEVEEIIEEYVTEEEIEELPELPEYVESLVTTEPDNWNGNWQIHFFETGVLKFTELNAAGEGIDVFVCGGGGNGGYRAYYDDNDNSIAITNGGGGGGGGYRTNAFDERIAINKNYVVTIGGPGGTTDAFGISASGGNDGGDGRDVHSNGGGSGGSGGSPGGNGASGDNGGSNGNDGVRAFLENNIGKRYGAGGAGGGGEYWSYNEYNWYERISEIFHGGADGGGNIGRDGNPNTGGGGGGAGVASSSGEIATSPGTGGSGIVIIRNKR